MIINIGKREIGTIIFVFLLVLFFLFSNYLVCSFLLLIFAIERFLFKIGNGVGYFEIIILLSSIQWIFVPAIFYEFYQEGNPLVIEYYKMAIDENSYFEFVIPGYCLMVCGLLYPSIYLNFNCISNIINDSKKLLTNKLIFIILGTGIFSFFMLKIVPNLFSYPFYLGSKLIFLSALFSQFSNSKFKVYLILVSVLFVILDFISTGMFGDSIFWILSTSLIFLLKYNFKKSSKVLIFFAGLYFIFLLQSIKFEYRLATWKTNTEKEGSSKLFFELFLNRIANPSEILNEETVYLMCMRLNQGRFISIIMDYVPKHEPFAKGETILTAFYSSLIPRFVWADKPRAGGANNASRFLGDDTLKIKDLSYNISVLGEAYANFGKFGGIIFMFFFGFFLNRILIFFIKLSNKNITLFFWLPIVFFGILTVEGEMLGITNTITMGTIFTFLFYNFFYLINKVNWSIK